MEILAIIPARGGSKGIPDKNIRALNGRPLLAYTAEAALGSARISRAVLSTDSEAIAGIGRELGLEVPFMRPDDLARDDTPALPVFQHVVRRLAEDEGYRPDAILILQPTSPMRETWHIDEAIAMFEDSDTDSLVSVVEVPHQYSPVSVMVKEGNQVSPYLDYDERQNLRQHKPVFHARNGAAIYLTRHDCLMQQNSLYGNRILGYEMGKLESLDLDDMDDWQLMEAWLQYRDSQAG